MFNGRNGYEVRSAGTEENARIKVTEGHIGWADIVFVMEKKHLKRLQDRFQAVIRNKRVICLDVPDNYKFMDEELMEILEYRVSEYIEI